MKWIVGIDEVGRGALAGPVVVAAAVLPGGAALRNSFLGRLKDSKKLSAKRREGWFAYLRGRADFSFALARVYPRQIEKKNISKAANLAAERAFARLAASRGLAAGTPIFLDGGLFLGNGADDKKKSRAGGRAIAKTIVRGDEKINAVKAASIVAKVYRDRLMCRLAKKYPKYRFEIHKGYGTEAHRIAIRKFGPCPAHRLTFAGKSSIMEA